jgi:HSP20 family protein
MAGILRRREGQGQEQGQGQQGRAMTAPQQAGMRGGPMQRQGMWDPFRSSGAMDPFRTMREMLSWDPFSEMASMLPAGRMFAPDIEVRETKDAYVINADLPGLREDDVSIDVSGNRLTISGKREEEQRDEGERYWAYERSYGSFTRSFTLPEGISADQIDANLNNGVLEVRIPKAKAEEPKRIQVKASGRAEEQGAASSTRPTTQGGTQSGTQGGTGTTESSGQQGTSQTSGHGGSQSQPAGGSTDATQGGSREKAA